MTIEEKRAHILSLIENPDNLMKLVKSHITDTLPAQPEAVLDIIIQILEGQ